MLLAVAARLDALLDRTHLLDLRLVLDFLREHGTPVAQPMLQRFLQRGADTAQVSLGKLLAHRPEIHSLFW